MMKLISVLILVVFTASGCFWPFRPHRPEPPSSVIAQGVSVEILDPAPLKNGGKFYFMPFSAGVEAEAGVLLDRLALMMIKGASDALAEGGGFTLVSGDDAANADIVLSGHIEQLKRIGHLKRKFIIKTRGDVRVQNAKDAARAGGNEVVALVFTQGEAADPGKGVDQAAYNMGYAIAKKLTEPGS